MDSTVCRTAPQKRHSKPCRFFQKDTCPLSADRCDFAHVKIQILPVRYSPGHPRPGQRDYGESVQPTAPMLPIDTGRQQPVAAFHRVPEAEYRQGVVSVTGRPATKVPHGPGFSSPGSKLAPVPDRGAAVLASSAVSVPSDGLVQLIFRGGDASPSPTSDVPSLSDGDSGPPSAACEAPELTERWPGSPAAFAPMVYCNPSPGLFSPGVPFASPAYCPWTAPKQESRSRSRRPGISSRKLKALKTKQCKFFKKEGRCPQGSLCTFIHDSSTVRSPSSTPDSPTGSCSSLQSASQPDVDTDDDRGRNIYPITWRVIGGGVMMGGQRQICGRFKEGRCSEGDDCQYAHVEEDGLDDTETLIEGPSSPTILTPRASNFPHEQMTDKSTKQLSVTMSPVTELVHDISPMVLSGRRLLTASGSRGELPPRPFSTPPRVSSRTETIPLDG